MVAIPAHGRKWPACTSWSEIIGRPLYCLGIPESGCAIQALGLPYGVDLGNVAPGTICLVCLGHYAAGA
jgi:hypothetical protein